ncbi:uncharacterized protein CLUP02_11005 [Colletotrichum lupini]|uniref:Ankyrin repeat protein n=1 Tax=Colletotrichum lupini TaxID=145971 RepID=A0A9Q8WJW7_9PEZI|nr:uncharacterized protein CLUP02_11005 [Colletotrichum lupini]UQC85507.1 hypothetical protein CLUP02_11005 [Colletotrichum lupini]
MNLGLDPNQAGDGAKSTFDVCLEHGHEVCTRVLISFGASGKPGTVGEILIDIHPSSQSLSSMGPTSESVQQRFSLESPIIQAVLSSTRVGFFNTALRLTIKWPATLEILISDDNIHPNTEVKNGAGHTPLCKAVCEGQYESTTLLLERGASPELIGRGQRPMDCAIHNKDGETS